MPTLLTLPTLPTRNARAAGRFAIVVPAVLTILLGIFLAGCATAPDVTLTYYPARAESTVSVTQSIACDKDKSFVLLSHVVLVETAYASDYAQPQSLRLGALGGMVADSAASFKFSDDGRLKSINASTTGQGEAIVKAASSLSALVLRHAALADAPNPCLAIARWGGDKPLTLVYLRRLTYTDAYRGETLALAPDPGSRRLFEQLRALAIDLPVLTLRSGVVPVRPAGSANSSTSAEPAVLADDATMLALKSTASVRLDVFAGADSIGGADLTIPYGATYYLPLPHPALFGKQDFALTLSEAGAITSLSYGHDTGAVGMVNAANAAALAGAPDSTAEQASAVKAQADLIRQQQRLSLCRLQPADCK